MQQLSEHSTTVDFAAYRSTLKNQAIVDEIEKRFKAFKPVTYDVNRQLKAIDAFEVDAVKNAEATKQAVDLELKDLAATLKNIEEARPFEDLTVVRLDVMDMREPDLTQVFRTKSLPPRSLSTRRPTRSSPRVAGWCPGTRYVRPRAHSRIIPLTISTGEVWRPRHCVIDLRPVILRIQFPLCTLAL